MISTEEVSSLLSYDAETGLLTWKVTTYGGRYGKNVIQKKGNVAGCKDKDGYIRIGIKGKVYQAHRLAWAIAHGAFPDGNIDHINGDQSDNRMINLRECTQSQNMANTGRRSDNKTGAKGVHYEAARNRFRADIRVNGKSKSLGRFKTIEEAACAYAKAAEAYFGSFARKG